MKSATGLPEGVESYDPHGFAVFNDSTFCESERHHPAEIDDGLHANSLAHMEAWQTVLSEWSRTQIHGCSKLRSLVKKGAPSSLRQQLWLNLLACKQLKQSSKFSYKASVRLIRQELVDIGISEYCLKDGHVDWTSILESRANFPVPPEVIRQITVDIGRTFPTHRQFMEGSLEAKEGRASLFRLLAVYAYYNPGVGYCQGMSYIAGMLLMQMTDEEEAFWAMVALFEKPKYLAGYFDQSLLRIRQHAAVFQKLITHRLPKLANHLASMDLHLLTFVTPWFMCLYTSFPCWDTVLTIWDLILLDGISTIFRVALAVLRVSQDELLQTSDISRILPRLLHPPPQLVSAETLLPVVWRTTADKWEIDALQAVIAEESDGKPGRKRRRRIDSDASSSEVAGKRPRSAGTDEGNETSVFQRVLGLFRSSNPQTRRGSTTRSQAARRRSSTRAGQTRHKTPGMAKASTLPKHNMASLNLTSSPNQPATVPETNEASSTQSKAPDLSINSTFSMVPFTDKSSAALCSTKALSTKSRAPDARPKSSTTTASVKWSKFYEPAPYTSPWTEGLRALTFSLPIQEGEVMIFGGNGGQQAASTVTEQSVSKENHLPGEPNHLLGKPNPALMEKLKAAVGLSDANNNSTNGLAGGSQEMEDDDRISPCLVATEANCTDSVLQQDSSRKQSSKRDSVKGVRFSPRLSDGRGTLRNLDNTNPLNTPSTRRIISRSAKIQHSFKTFNTPTPLRRSQVSRLDSSPPFSSPEVELQPMKLRVHMRKDVQE